MVSQCQTKKGKLMSNKKKIVPDSKTCQKPYKFDLEVKVQGRILIMNVSDTSPHGDTPI